VGALECGGLRVLKGGKNGRSFSVDSAGMANGLQPPVPCTCICISCRVVLLTYLFICRRVLNIAESDWLASSCLCLCLSDLPSAWNNSAPTGPIFMTFDIWIFFFKFCLENSSSVTIEQEYPHFTYRPIYIFVHIALKILLRTINVLDKSCRGNQNTHFRFSNFFTENHAVWEITWIKYCTAGTDHRWQYGACALHPGYLRLQTNTRNM